MNKSIKNYDLQKDTKLLLWIHKHTDNTQLDTYFKKTFFGLKLYTFSVNLS